MPGGRLKHKVRNAVSDPEPFLIVGIGGSAGSVTALQELFQSVPPASGMAFVVIVHLSPDHESRLAEVIQNVAAIPVSQVTEPVKVIPNHAYVIPPDKSLSMADGMLILTDRRTVEERRAPIDMFFRALGDNHGRDAVSVVLSGTGADGSSGIRRVKEHNGLVVVQDPAEATFDEMPRNSIATGVVDLILPVAEMPARLAEFRRQVQAVQISPGPADAAPESSDDALSSIFALLRSRTGHDFANYKPSTILRRIARRLAVLGLPDLPAYVAYLNDEGEEAPALLKELLISVTNFFRDPFVFEMLQRTVIPQLFEGKGRSDQIRVWVAGCATGEEAYSIAMLLAEYAATLPHGPSLQIFATDLDQNAIAHARKGCYSSADVADVSADRLRRFFVREQDEYRVAPELREQVLFARHNLLKDPPFSQLDFASCRNLLIYLNGTAQQRALELLHFALKTNAQLLLGTSETAEASAQLFVTADKETRLFRSRPVPRVVGLRSTSSHAADPAPHPRERTTPQPPGAVERLLPIEMHHRLLEQYAAPSVLVDSQHNIIHLTARGGHYLHFAGGTASLDLLEVIHPPWRAQLQSALFEAAQSRVSVVVPGLEEEGGDQRTNLVVRPVFADDNPAQTLFLILFEPAESKRKQRRGSRRDVDPPTRQLEEELLQLRAQTRVTVEQYEAQAEEFKAGNEELQAMNEELRSTAEELETSKEELQSVNEELQTVNQELKVKIEETTQTSNDLRNLMSATKIGTIFLDRALRVKLFTPSVREVFSLIPADIGRPLMDIASRLADDNVVTDAEQVLEHLQAIEREVGTRDGRWYLMRLHPYRTADDRIDGVVVTFFDITARREAEAAAQDHEERYGTLFRSIDEGFVLHEMVTNEEGRVDFLYLEANPAFAAQTGLPSVHGRSIRLAGPAADDEWIQNYASVVQSGEPLRFRRHLASVGRWFDIHVSRVGPARSKRLAVVFSDVTDRVRIEEQAASILDELEQRVSHRTGQLSVARAEAERLLAEKGELLERIIKAQEEERQRIARELHDEMGQHLTALKVRVEGLAVGGESSSGVEQLMTLVTQLDRTVDRLTLELRPPALEGLGLVGAIASLVESAHAAHGPRIDVQTNFSAGQRLPENVEIALYRVLQEALTNVQKHARAANISVILERQNGLVQLIIEDDGTGFPVETTPPMVEAERHFGLLGIRERLSIVGGTFTVETSGGGSTLYVRVPLAEGVSVS